MIKLASVLFALLSILITPIHVFAGSSGLGVRTVYSSTNVGTTNWVVLSSSLPNTVSSISVFDSSGQTMEIGMCNASATANSEVRQFLVPPGGIAVKIQIPSNQRISIRAVSAAATTGESDMNALF